MLSKAFAAALLLSSVATAAPALQARQDDPCQDAYKVCVAAGTPEVACACRWAACLGQDNARNREFCASATASLNLPAPTTVTPGATISLAPPLPPPGATISLASPLPPGPTISLAPPLPPPGPTISLASPLPPSSAATKPVAAPTAGSKPVPVSPPKSWVIKNLIRYCGEDNTGCDYNFAVTADGKTESCTIVRMPGKDAATESWSNQKCNSGSDLTISWGYVAQPAPAYAVITVVKGKQLAWFGVPDVNGQKVTPNSPFGSGDYGTLPASPVYTY